MLLLTFSARSSRACEIRGKANFESTHIVIRNASSVQIINPIPGWTRKLPPLVAAFGGGQRRGR